MACACGRFGFDITAGNDPDAGDVEEPAVDASIDPDALAASSCGALDAIVCDGFESGIGDWTTNESGGSVSVVTEPVFRGTRAIRVQTGAPGAVAEVIQTHAPITDGNIYLRAYYYLPSTLVTPGTVELTTTGEGTGVHSHVTINENEVFLLLNDERAPGSQTIARDTWFCVEIDHVIGATGSGAIRVNGVDAGTLTGRDTVIPTGYAFEAFGLVYTADATGPLEAFIDEVAVDTEPIGCL